MIDFWRVEDLRHNCRLLLRSEMKLPGRAWLEFIIENGNGIRHLAVTARFVTKSKFGKVYWYVFFPFHHLIFQNLIKEIERRS